VEEMTCSDEEFPAITVDVLDALVRELKERMPSEGLYLTNWGNEGYTLPSDDHVVPRRWLADMGEDEREGIEAWHTWTLRRDYKERWAKMARIDVRSSIEEQLGAMTQDDVDRFCNIANLAKMTTEEFGEWFEDWSLEGLAQLLTARIAE